MRAVVLNCRIVKMLTLFVMIIPRLALGDVNIVHTSRQTDTSKRGLAYELDPQDNWNCLSLGALEIIFRTNHYGPPYVGVVLTDPRGRRIGFDPLTKHAWDALPVAQGYIDCDDLDGHGACRGVVEVCGPISGTYKLEVIAQQTAAYSVSVSGRSKQVFESEGVRSCHSGAHLNNIAIRGRSRNIIFLNYSRDPQNDVSAQLQHTGRAQSLELHSHRHVEMKSAEHPVAGQ